MLSNEVVSKIFDLLKNKKLGSYNIDNFVVEITRAKIKDIPGTFDNFKIDAKTTEDFIVYVSILINEDFSELDYQSLNYALYEVIRHELEHINKLTLDKKPDGNYVDIYNQLLFVVDLEEHVNLVSQYILSEVEFDSYLRSIIYAAKKQKRSAIEVIEQVLKRAFFNNNTELMTEGNKNENIKAIVEETRQVLRKGLVRFNPKFKEMWL